MQLVIVPDEVAPPAKVLVTKTQFMNEVFIADEQLIP